LGPSVHVVPCRDDASHEPPSFVAGHLRALGIERLLELDDGYAYLLAPERVAK
jgi:hypothetical protein